MAFLTPTQMGASEEYTGPSLAFVPLRGAKGCAQDDKLKSAVVIREFRCRSGL
jgi:hypothetical protein